MTTTGFSQRSVAALAALVAEIRPSWDEPGIAAEIRRHAHLPLGAVVQAVVRAALDPRNETPAVLSQQDFRGWTGADVNPCRLHPDQRAMRVNGECASCYANRCGIDAAPMSDRGGRPIPPETKAAMKAALHRPSEAAAGVVL